MKIGFRVMRQAREADKLHTQTRTQACHTEGHPQKRERKEGETYTTIIHSLAPFRFVGLIVFHEGLHQVLGPLGSGSLFGG